MNILQSLQDPVDRVLHIGIEVYRVNEFHIRMGDRGIPDRMADLLKGCAETLPAVAGD